MGLGRHDRIAIVLPQGPEMAVVFVAVAACATAAPLNPAYRTSEFEFYLADLHAKALIDSVGNGLPGASRCSGARDSRHRTSHPCPNAAAGIFTLSRSGSMRVRFMTALPKPEMWRSCCTLQAQPHVPKACR